jgi:hypothetical protein
LPRLTFLRPIVTIIRLQGELRGVFRWGCRKPVPGLVLTFRNGFFLRLAEAAIAGAIASAEAWAGHRDKTAVQAVGGTMKGNTKEIYDALAPPMFSRCPAT